MPFAGTAWRSGGTLRRTPGNAASRAARILPRTLRTRRRKHRTWPRQTRCRAPCMQRRAGIRVHNPYRARCSAALASGRLLRDRQSNSGRTYRRSRNMLECILRTVDEPFAISLSGGCNAAHIQCEPVQQTACAVTVFGYENPSEKAIAPNKRSIFSWMTSAIFVGGNYSGDLGPGGQPPSVPGK